MRHLAALAVLSVTLLAVPTAAMASSTAGSGPLNGHPGPVGIACPPPFPFVHKHAKVQFIRLKPLPHGKHVRIRIICPRPPFLKGCRLRLPFFAVASASGNLTVVPGSTPAPAGRFRCPGPPFPPGCRLQPLVFDVASGSSNLTEVSGPTLAPAEEFFYDGGIYTIMTVNPGADSFTVFHDNVLFTNSGPAITDGHGILLCSG
jgi:hypothetical protein